MCHDLIGLWFKQCEALLQQPCVSGPAWPFFPRLAAAQLAEYEGHERILSLVHGFHKRFCHFVAGRAGGAVNGMPTN